LDSTRLSTLRSTPAQPRENICLGVIRVVSYTPELVRRFLSRKNGPTVVLLFLVVLMLFSAAKDVPYANVGFLFSLFSLVRVLSGNSTSEPFLLKLVSELRPMFMNQAKQRRVASREEAQESTVAQQVPLGNP